jgi:hypothetical protein
MGGKVWKSIKDRILAPLGMILVCCHPEEPQTTIAQHPRRGRISFLRKAKNKGEILRFRSG